MWLLVCRVTRVKSRCGGYRPGRLPQLSENASGVQDTGHRTQNARSKDEESQEKNYIQGSVVE